jgi:hypothetical protein
LHNATVSGSNTSEIDQFMPSMPVSVSEVACSPTESGSAASQLASGTLSRVDAATIAAARQPVGTLVPRSDRLTPTELADELLAVAGLRQLGRRRQQILALREPPLASEMSSASRGVFASRRSCCARTFTKTSALSRRSGRGSVSAASACHRCKADAGAAAAEPLRTLPDSCEQQ